jgi:guanylate kinase
MITKTKNKLFVISGESGSGKTTLFKNIIIVLPNISYSVSITTRKKRPGEINKKDYTFVSEKKFFELRKNRKFLEWARVYGDYYGTSKNFIIKAFQNKNDVIMDIDTMGAMKIKRKIKNACLIFILPPNLLELKTRLKNRKTDSEEAIRKRLKFAKKEISQKKFYNYVLINKNLKETLSKLISIINKER